VSHNTITLNSTAPTAAGLVAPTIAGAAHYSTIVTINFGSGNSGAGTARSFRRQSASYAAQTLTTGFSIALSPRRQPLVASSDWYEMINVPAGTWLAEFKVATDESTTFTGGRVALYNNSTGAVVSPIISFRDRNRCALALAIVPGGVSYEIRIFSGTVNNAPNVRATGVSGWTFRKIA